MRPILAVSALSLLFAAFPFASSVEAGTTPACPYTAAELSAAVGVPVDEGAGPLSLWGIFAIRRRPNSSSTAWIFNKRP